MKCISNSIVHLEIYRPRSSALSLSSSDVVSTRPLRLVMWIVVSRISHSNASLSVSSLWGACVSQSLRLHTVPERLKSLPPVLTTLEHGEVPGMPETQLPACVFGLAPVRSYRKPHPGWARHAAAVT